MKKLLSLVLSLSLLFSLGMPAMAQTPTGTDARLQAVTAAVKAKLDLDTSPYTSFRGDLEEGILAPTWSLYWEGEGISLSIQAEEDGTVLSLRRYEQAPEGDRNVPSKFPSMTWAQAQETALSFLTQLGLTAAFDQADGTLSIGDTSARFSGTLLHEGLPTQRTFSLSVRLSDGQVTTFSRDSFGAKHINSFPSATPKTTLSQAEQALLSTLNLKLEYVLTQEGSQAVLHYLPVWGNDFYVDAQTGKLVDLTALYEQMAEKGKLYAGGGAAPGERAGDMAVQNAATALSQAELEGAALLAGAMDKDSLDKAARSLTALGLSKYTLGTVRYNVEEDGEGESVITAALTYAKQVDRSVGYRTVALNAKTGALLGVSSSAAYEENRTISVSAATARQRADTFLTAQAGENFALTELYDSTAATPDGYSASHAFHFARRENGYFFQPQSLRVSVDVSDGSIAFYEADWHDAVSFESPEGIVNETTALATYLATCGVTLGYLDIPTALDPSQPQWRPLVESGYGYLYSYLLAYSLADDRACHGVVAKTGEAVATPLNEAAPLAYGDLSGHWAEEMISALAAYDVGYLGKDFLPAKELTQVELLALLATSRGMPPADFTDEACVNGVYGTAYSMGLLTPDQRQDTAPVTRGELTRMLVVLAGFDRAAQLSGIWATGFADQADIPAQLMGYAAIASGLGLVSGDSAGHFAAGRVATRAEAAVMLYHLLNG